jgi:BirA family biotin operon repressor/biotin-[acetyl-CoA-carboxylase] ligase
MIPLPPYDVRHHDTQWIGRQVWAFGRVDSTNTLALALAGDYDKDGLVLLADEQSGGRGQYGRTWTAPAGSSVLLSVLLFPPAHLRRPAMLTAWAAVSVCQTIAQVAGLDARIKWPNDVLVDDRKVCGILMEQRQTGSGEKPLATVAGIGLNVQQSADFFVQADLPLAASLASLTGKEFETGRVATRLIQELDVWYGKLVEGDTETLQRLWKQRLGLVGRRVLVETFDKKLEGRLLEVTWDGVVLQDGQGTIRMAPELVRHIDEAGSPLS